MEEKKKVQAIELSLKKVIKLAIFMEMEGIRFYSYLSEHLSDPTLRDFFLKLLGVEMQHEKSLRELLNKVPDEEAWLSEVHETESQKKYFMHIATLSSKRVYPDEVHLSHRIEGLRTPKEALELAIEIEGNASKLYNMMKSHFNAPEIKRLLGQLAKDEEGHRNNLANLFKKAAVEKAKLNKS